MDYGGYGNPLSSNFFSRQFLRALMALMALRNFKGVGFYFFSVGQPIISEHCRTSRPRANGSKVLFLVVWACTQTTLNKKTTDFISRWSRLYLVEVAGVEPASKQGTQKLSTRLADHFILLPTPGRRQPNVSPSP